MFSKTAVIEELSDCDRAPKALGVGNAMRWSYGRISDLLRKRKTEARVIWQQTLETPGNQAGAAPPQDRSEPQSNAKEGLYPAL